MKSYKELSRDELLELQGALNKEYADAKSKGLSLIWQEENRLLNSWDFPWGLWML